VANRRRKVGAVSAHFGALWRGQPGSGPEWVFDGRARSEGKSADTVVVAHAELGDSELGGDARFGVRNEIDAPTPVDGDEDAQSIEWTAELDSGHRRAEPDERKRREELARHASDPTLPRTQPFETRDAREHDE
jgi:hypothetical protein